MLRLLSFAFAAASVAYYYYIQRPDPNARVRTPQELNNTYDYIIVGAGSAGCVLGARLSEDPSASVLVLEAGGEEDYYWFSHIPGFAPHLQIGDFDWEYKTEPQKFCCNAFVNRESRWPRGKGLGGCSSHNYMNYVRCSPEDYNHWANNLNNTGWSYKEVLPYFKKMEKYEIEHLQGLEDVHGYDGPLIINEGYHSPLGESLREALKREGYKFNDDTNGKTFDGFSWAQFNIDKRGRRMSTAKRYLRPAMNRPNLHVVVFAHVTKVLIESTEPGSSLATGVEYIHNGRKHTVKARKEVILSGGAVNSPQLLMLSGIGPKQQLEQFSIPVLVDNPAVGANLDDHIAVFLEYRTNSNGLTDAHMLHTWYGHYKALAQYFLFGSGPLVKTANEITGFVNSGLQKTKLPDLQLYLFNPYPFMDDKLHFSREASNRRKITVDDISFLLSAVHLHPSDKGEIRLQSANPLIHPIIDHHYLQTEIDVDVLAEGLRILADIAATSPELKAFDIQYAENPPPECEKHEILSQDYLKCTIRDRALTLYHPIGTCRMGKKGQNSVVDTDLRVHGVERLRVVDASVFPDQVSGNTHAPVVMVAEKAADIIKNAARQ